MSTKKTKRAELLARMTELMNDNSDGLSEAQQKEWDKCKSQIELMDLSGADENGLIPRKVPMEQIREHKPYENNQNCWIDSNGKKVKVFANNERLSNNPDGLSVGRYLRGCLTGKWDGASLEKRMGVTTSNNGQYLIPTPLSEILVDYARANMVLVKAGAQTVNMDSSTLKIAKVLTDPTVSVKAELESADDSPPTFDQVELSSKTIVAYATFSQEWLNDALNAPEMLEQVMIGALAAKIDFYGLQGQGTTEPTGIIYTSGINTVDVELDTWNYDALLGGLRANQEANCSTTNAYILSPKVNYELSRLKDSNNNYIVQPSDVAALPKHITTSIDKDDLVIGDFRQMILGLRQEITFQTSPIADEMFKKFGMAVRCVARIDWAVARANHFCFCSENVS